jgi:flagellar basal-body rod protein FlgC
VDAVRIATSGLDVEWQRLQIIAQNLANMNSTRSADGHVYRPLTLVSGADASFSSMVDASGLSPSGVHIVGLEEQPGGSRRVYQPGHPQADASGFVTYPNIDHAAEMTLMIKTSRVYEANLVTVNIAQQMYSHALDIGRQA